MSKILKASHITINNNFVIDNSFDLEQQGVLQAQPIENGEDTHFQEESIQLNIQENAEEVSKEIIENAKTTADEIIENAKIEANEILKNSEEEISIKAEQIYNENKQNGYEQGYEDGLSKASAEYQDKLREAEENIQKTLQERQDTIRNLEPEIINFIIDTTKNILTNSFQFNPQIISLLIKKGLSNIKDLKNIKIYISQENYDFVENNKKDILSVDTEKNNIEILVDNSFGNMDCLIETELGNIQCGVDDQFSSLKEALYYILN